MAFRLQHRSLTSLRLATSSIKPIAGKEYRVKTRRINEPWQEEIPGGRPAFQEYEDRSFGVRDLPPGRIQEFSDIPPIRGPRLSPCSIRRRPSALKGAWVWRV